MASWRFYQGLRTEWRWYHFDSEGQVISESDQGFAELRACMANAETAGFTGEAYQVHARQAGTNIPIQTAAGESEEWHPLPAANAVTGDQAP